MGLNTSCLTINKRNHRYIHINYLLKGGYGKIDLVSKKGIKYIMKTVSKNDEQNINELYYLKKIKHKNIILLKDLLENNQYYKFIFKYYHQGDLFYLFEYYRNKNIQIEERLFKNFVKNILETLDYLNKNKLVHLDVKPENILIKNVKKGEFILTDLGCMHKFTEYDKLESLNFPVGTKYFMPPEVKKSNFCSNSDIWSLGLTILFFYSEFYLYNENYFIKRDYTQEKINKIIDSVDLPNNTKEFISCFLIVEHNKRFNTSMLLNHKFLN